MTPGAEKRLPRGDAGSATIKPLSARVFTPIFALLAVASPACTSPKPLTPNTPVLYLQRDPVTCGEGSFVAATPSYSRVKVGKLEIKVAPTDLIAKDETKSEWVCVIGNADFTYGKLDNGKVVAGPNLRGKRETLAGAKYYGVPKAWSDAFAQAQAGMVLREEAVKAKPMKPKDWDPQEHDLVLWRRNPYEPWEAYNVLWAIPVVQGVFRELWQPKNVQVLNEAKVEDVFPYPDPEDRPRIEDSDFVMCTVIDPNMASHRSSRLGKVERRVGDMLTVMDEDGGKRRVHANDCLKLITGR